MTKRRLRLGAIILAAAVAAVTTVTAQRPGGRPNAFAEQSYTGNVRYDGRFVFIRMSYPWSGRGAPFWSHDYPVGEYHFLKILGAVSNVSAHQGESSIMSFGDPELHKFPVAYFCEPGQWYLNDGDVLNLRAYLQKGGFLIVDDFPRNAWGNFELQMSRVFPQARWIRLDAKHQIFHSFFEIDDISNIPISYDRGGAPEFYGLFEDNDPTKRMMMVVNYQQDISEFWEWSDSGTYMVRDSNEAYKIGVNEFLYGITH
jgi:hypothetical protein